MGGETNDNGWETNGKKCQTMVMDDEKPMVTGGKPIIIDEKLIKQVKNREKKLLSMHFFSKIKFYTTFSHFVTYTVFLKK